MRFVIQLPTNNVTLLHPGHTIFYDRHVLLYFLLDTYTHTGVLVHVEAQMHDMGTGWCGFSQCNYPDRIDVAVDYLIVARRHYRLSLQFSYT